MIRNTTADMNDGTGADALLLLASAMTTGGPGEFIEAQEKAGQSQLVYSDRLPTEVNHCTDADFEALGFTFGDTDPGDPLFRPATPPEGWTRQASDHSMWSHVVDTLGRKRVGVFYKAAYYDRKANMSLTSVYSYVSEHGYYGTELIPDDVWATPQAITTEALAAIRQCDEHIEMYSDERYSRDGDDYGPSRVAELQVQRGRYEALVSRFGAEAGTR